jgi:hypothetical protein
MTTCMGGWCHLRDKCRHHAPNRHRPVVERLCEDGKSDAFEPLTRPGEERKEWVLALEVA